MSSARLHAFLGGGSAGLCHADYWARVADLWRTADAEERDDPRWRDVWAQARLAPGSDRGLMTEEERRAFAELPAGERDGAVALFLVGGEAEVVRAPQ